MGVAPSEVDRISGTKVHQQLTKEGFVPLPVVDGQARVGRRANQECLYLSDSGCSIHSEAGAAAKPSVCRLFPFSLINTPDGYYVSLSFSCPSVMAGMGRQATEHLQELTEIVADSPYFTASNPVPDGLVTVMEGERIAWKDYLELEERILDGLSMESPIQDLLALACMQVCGQGGTANQVYQEARRIMPYFVANTISIMELPDSYEEREEVVEALLTGGCFSGLLGHRMPPLEDLWSLNRQLTRQLVNRYVQNKIWGKKLTSGPTVVARILMLAVAIAILLHYARAKRADHGDPTYDVKDLEWSFDLIEANLFTHSTDLLQTFLQFERSLVAYKKVFEAA